MSKLEEAAKEYRLHADLNHERYMKFGSNIINAFIAGANWQKEQMMKNSFEATVCKICNTYLKEMDKDAIAKVFESYSNGDKVKVIIIKEE